MSFGGMAIIAAGMAFFLVRGGRATPCPPHTIEVNLTASDGVQVLNEAMNCTGAGVYNVTLSRRLQIQETIEISGPKNVFITGSVDNAVTDTSGGSPYAAIDAGGTTGMFVVSDGAMLNIKYLTLEGGFSEYGAAVSVTSSSFFMVSGCVFTNNRASTAGGERTP